MKTFRRVLAVLLVAVTIVAVGGAPAHAGPLDCLSGRVCVWSSSDYSGLPTYYWTIPGGSGGVCYNFGGSLNDNVDSWIIRAEGSGRSATMYANANCSGNAISYIAPPWFGGPDRMNCYSGSWSTHHCLNYASQGSSFWLIK